MAGKIPYMYEGQRRVDSAARELGIEIDALETIERGLSSNFSFSKIWFGVRPVITSAFMISSDVDSK